MARPHLAVHILSGHQRERERAGGQIRDYLLGTRTDLDTFCIPPLPLGVQALKDLLFVLNCRYTVRKTEDNEWNNSPFMTYSYSTGTDCGKYENSDLSCSHVFETVYTPRTRVVDYPVVSYQIVPTVEAEKVCFLFL